MTQVVVYGTSERLPWSSVPDPSWDREILARRSAGGREPGCVNSANVRLWRRQRRQADGFFFFCRPVIVHGHGDMSFRSYAYVIVRFDERAHARSSVTLSVKTTLGNRPALDASSGMPHADVVFRHVGVRRTGRRLTLIGDGMRACRCGEGVCLSGRRSMVWYSCRRSRRFDRFRSLVPSSCSYSQTGNDTA